MTTEMMAMPGTASRGLLASMRNNLQYAEQKLGHQRTNAVIRFGSAMVSFAALGWVSGRTKNHAFFDVVPFEVPVGVLATGLALVANLTRGDNAAGAGAKVESAAEGLALVAWGTPLYKLTAGWGLAARQASTAAAPAAPAASKGVTGMLYPEIIGAGHYGGGALTAAQAAAMSR